MLGGIDTFSFTAVFNGQFCAKLPKALYVFFEYLHLKLLINASYNSRRIDTHPDNILLTGDLRHS